MEPITIFSRLGGPEKVVQLLREFGLEFQQHGGDHDWTKIVVALEIDGAESNLTISNSVEYYSEPNWSQQMAGMRGYFSQFPPSENRDKAIALTTTFEFSLGTIIDPKVMDFQDFAKNCWFGPLSIENLPIVNGDLGLFDKRIDEATDEELSLASSSAVERHLAINWLCAGPDLYSEADAST